MQTASDIFLEWMSGPSGAAFLLAAVARYGGFRRLGTFSASDYVAYGSVCGWVLARAYARAGDPMEIAAYLGTSNRFDRAVTSFAKAYANHTERDCHALLTAIKTGRIVSTTLS